MCWKFLPLVSMNTRPLFVVLPLTLVACGAGVCCMANRCAAQEEPGPKANSPSNESPTSDSDNAVDDAVAVVQSYCIDCHAGTAAEAGLNLESLRDEAFVLDNRRMALKILARVSNREMPPRDGETPTDRESAELVNWIEKTLQSDPIEISPGPPLIRRLNRFEYGMTMRDLLGIHVDVAQGLPLDAAGGEGFDNASETLFLSPVHIEKYLQAAQLATEYVARDTTARTQLFSSGDDVDGGTEVVGEFPRAERILKPFLTRAFRRPCDDGQLKLYASIFKHERELGRSFENSILSAVEAALTSPYFLFRVEAPVESDVAELVNGYELATRLSYFLWSSMPDEELFEMASRQQLNDPAELARQVRRMLTVTHGSNRSDVPKARALAENFSGQWLGTRDLGTRFKPDASVFDQYDGQIEFAMRSEPAYFLEYMLVENRSLLDLLDADYSFMNGDLADHYGLRDRVKIRGYGQMRHVELPEGSHRGGVLTMGAALAISSYPHRTSPVLRGKWVLETFFDTTLPPPPPDVPKLDETALKSDKKQSQSLRQQLEAHRAQKSCAACHDLLDPLGFGLENYDAIGRWREDVDGAPVDVTGTFSNGTTFNGPDEMKQRLLDRKDEFVRSLTAKMLAYALGRGLVNDDFHAVETIFQNVKANDYSTQELLIGIVQSKPFRYKARQQP